MQNNVILHTDVGAGAFKSVNLFIVTLTLAKV